MFVLHFYDLVYVEMSSHLAVRSNGDSKNTFKITSGSSVMKMESRVKWTVHNALCTL